MTSTISFPGLGIGEFTINRTAFTIFGINVQWYGLILTTGILVAFILFYRPPLISDSKNQMPLSLCLFPSTETDIRQKG